MLHLESALAVAQLHLPQDLVHENSCLLKSREDARFNSSRAVRARYRRATAGTRPPARSLRRLSHRQFHEHSATQSFAEGARLWRVVGSPEKHSGEPSRR